MSIATPEGLVLDLVLAGLGSRFIAGLLDALVRGGILLLVFIAVGITGSSGAGVAVLAISWFLLVFVYDIAFELAAGGRTPGKRWTGLRVVTTSGAAVGAGASVVRNVLRVIDMLPGIYLLGMVLITFNRRHQRLGDMLGGTLVVRERREQQVPGASFVPVDAALDESLLTWDVSGVTAEELATVRRFLERRAELEHDARRRLAEQIASRLKAKVVSPEERQTAEQFLEDLVRVKSHRR